MNILNIFLKTSRILLACNHEGRFSAEERSIKMIFEQTAGGAYDVRRIPGND